MTLSLFIWVCINIGRPPNVTPVQKEHRPVYPMVGVTRALIEIHKYISLAKDSQLQMTGSAAAWSMRKNIPNLLS